jgi:hypothetical protein
VLKPDPFDGKNFLIWKAKMELWLTAMSCFHAAEGKPVNLPPEDEAKFKAEDNLFRGAVISALDTKFQKSYIILPTGKELWDALVGKFGVIDAGSELYPVADLGFYIGCATTIFYIQFCIISVGILQPLSTHAKSMRYGKQV